MMKRLMKRLMIQTLDKRWQIPLQELFAQTRVNNNQQAFVLTRQPDFFRLLPYQGKRSAVLGACRGDVLLGAMTVHLEQYFIDGEVRWGVYTADLKVHVNARGQGIGDALMQSSVEWARAQVDNPLFLTTVAADNPAGLRKNQKLAPWVTMQKNRELATVFYPCMARPALVGTLPRHSPNAGGRFQVRTLRMEQPAQRENWWRLWQQCALTRQGQRVYTSELSALPPAQIWLGLFEGDTLVGALGLWDQRAYRQVTVPYQPRLMQHWLYAGEQAVALWCGVHLCVLPTHRRAVAVLLAHARQWVGARGGRLLGLAFDRQDPLSAWLCQGLYQTNALYLLSSEPFRKSYPFHAELALG